jgi:hypothetical protein
MHSFIVKVRYASMVVSPPPPDENLHPTCTGEGTEGRSLGSVGPPPSP